MKPPDPNENGGPVSETTARMITPVAKPKDDALGELVNGVTIVHGDLRLWLREAFNLLGLTRTEPEKGLRYLALWFARLARVIA